MFFGVLGAEALGYLSPRSWEETDTSDNSWTTDNVPGVVGSWTPQSSVDNNWQENGETA